MKEKTIIISDREYLASLIKTICCQAKIISELLEKKK